MNNNCKKHYNIEKNMISITNMLWGNRYCCYHKYHGRYLYLCRVTDESLAQQLINNECYQLYKWHPDYIILRFPELCLYDLSNPRPPFSVFSSKQLIEMWEQSNIIIDKITNDFGCTHITGKNLQVALYACGPNTYILEKLYQQFIKNLHIKYRSTHKNESVVNVENAKLRKSKPEYIDIFLKLIYDDYIRHFGNATRAWSPNTYINMEHVKFAITSWLASTNCSIGFIFHAGLQFLIDYLIFASGDTSNIFVTEVHLENDPLELLKRNISDLWVYPKRTIRKRCIIADKALSGGTLLKAKKLLPSNPYTLALYPKSYSAITNADYSYFAGKLFSQKYITKLDVGYDNWFRYLILCDEGNVNL